MTETRVNRIQEWEVAGLQPDFIPQDTVPEGGPFHVAALAIVSRLSQSEYWLPAMPTINTISRAGENNSHFLFNQVLERARVLMADEKRNSVNQVGDLWHLTTRPASSHTPVSMHGKQDQAAHFINWLFKCGEDNQAEFFSTQALADLNKVNPDKYQKILQYFATGIAESIREVSRNSGLPLEDVITYFQTGATDKALRQSQSFSQGSASLPTVHSHTIAAGDRTMIRQVEKPINAMVKHFQTLDNVLMKCVGPDLVRLIEHIFPKVEASIVRRTDNTAESFSGFSAIELNLPEGTTVVQALEYSLQIIRIFEPISQASLEYMSANKSVMAKASLIEVMQAQGIDDQAISNYLKFLKTLKPTNKQLYTPIDAKVALEQYEEVLIVRDSLLALFENVPVARANPRLLAKLIWALHELDRLRISKEQANKLGLSDEELSKLELDVESKYTVGHPLSVDVLLKNYEEKDSEICVKNLWIHFPVIGLSGAFDLHFGTTLLR
jgi:hypothetical protein